MVTLKINYANGDTYYADATAGEGSGVNAIATQINTNTTTLTSLDWDTAWTDAVHNHSSDAEGGSTLTTGNITTGNILPSSDDAKNLGSASYRWQYLYLSETLTTDGSIDPEGTGATAGSLGNASHKWNYIYGVNITEGDHIFSERECPICSKQFKEGESIVNYALSNTEEGTRCIPAHLKCCIEGNESAESKAKHPEVIQYLKDNDKYISPTKIEKK